MQRLLFTVLSALLLNSILISVARALPPSGDSNPSDLYNSTVDHGQIINPHPESK